MDTESALDFGELQRLLGLASRPRIRELLQREMAILEAASAQSHSAAIAAAPPEGCAAVSNSAASAPVISVPRSSEAAPVLLNKEKAPSTVSYATVSSFSWDQDSEKVKIYFFLDGASKERTELEVRPTSVDVRMRDVQGRNLRFGVPHLCRAVDPSGSKVLVKPGRVTVILKKRDRGHWPDLAHKDDKLKPKTSEPGSDPMGGLMDLMKNMYDDGDDEMKRTIAKAWSDARTGNTADPLSSSLGDL